MKYIDKIEICFFRSLNENRIENFNDLNIFSGKNDSGKSNILKAMDLFFNTQLFNFQFDYIKVRLGHPFDANKKALEVYNSKRLHYL